MWGKRAAVVGLVLLSVAGGVGSQPGMAASVPMASESATWTALGLQFADGYVTTWGEGENGEALAPVPVEVTRDYVVANPDRRVVSVATGVGFTLALTRAGRVVAWGSNSHGQTSVPIEAQARVIKIAAGSHHAYALRDDGRLIAWGSDECGQISLPLEAQTDIIDVATSECWGMAVTSSGNIVSLGHPGGIEAGKAPIPPEAQGDVAQVFTQDLYWAAVKEDGRVILWFLSWTNESPPTHTFYFSRLPDNLRGPFLDFEPLGRQPFAQVGDDTFMMWSWNVNEPTQARLVSGVRKVSRGWSVQPGTCALSLSSEGLLDVLPDQCGSSRHGLKPIPKDAARQAVDFDWSYWHAAAVIGVADVVPQAFATPPSASSYKRGAVSLGVEVWPNEDVVMLPGTPGWPAPWALRADTWMEVRSNRGVWVRVRQSQGTLRENHIFYPQKSVGFLMTLSRLPSKRNSLIEVRMVNSAGPGPVASVNVLVK